MPRYIVVDERGPTNLAGFASLPEAEAYIVGLQVIDAKGVFQGNYSIDGPCDEEQI